MKKIAFVLGFSFFAFACNNGSQETAATHHDMSHEEIIEYVKAHPDEKVDPVCGMPEQKGLPYTEFTIWKSDSVWFCSPHCKGQFDKEPQKYAVK